MVKVVKVVKLTINTGFHHFNHSYHFGRLTTITGECYQVRNTVSHCS